MSSKSTAWAIEQQGLSPTAKLVLIIMADSASSTGVTFSSNKTIASLAGFLKEDTVAESQKKLVEMNLLADTGKRVGATGRVKVFQLPAPACHTAPCLEDLMCFGNPPSNGSLNPDAIPCQLPANPPLITRLTGRPLKREPVTRNKEGGKPPKFNPASVPLPPSLRTTEFAQAWCAWCDERAAKKKPITERAAELQLKNLSSWGVKGAIESIETSISNGYQGLFAPREVKSRQSYTKPPANIYQPWGAPL